MRKILVLSYLGMVAVGAGQTRISELLPLTGSNAVATDVVPIVDVSAGDAGSKKITLAELFSTPVPWQGVPIANAYIAGAATWNAKEGPIAAGTTGQYWRGDKSWQTLNASAVGLGNVNNTSDAGKPVSTAAQTALDGKANVNGGNVTGNDRWAFKDNILAGSLSAGVLGNTVSRLANETGENRTVPNLMVVSMGDSYAVALDNWIDEVGIQQGSGFMANSGFASGGSYSEYAPAQSRSMGSFYTITSGQTATMNVSFRGLRAHVFYGMENGAGSFRVEQQLDGGSWTDLNTGTGAMEKATAASPVVTDNGGGITAGVLTIDWNNTATQLRRLRFVHTSGGTVRLLGFHSSNTLQTGSSLSDGGTEVSTWATGGLDVAHESSCPQGVYDAIFGTLRPHIVTFKNDNDVPDMNNVATIMSKVEEATKYDSTLLRLGAATGAGTYTLQLAMDFIQANETLIGDETMVSGQYYKIDTVGTTNFELLGAPAGFGVGTIFRKNTATTYGTGTVYRMSSDSVPRTITYVTSGSTAGPTVATGVKAALDAVPNFTTYYDAIIQHDNVLVKRKQAGRCAALNISTAPGNTGIASSPFSTYRRSCKPDWILVGTHPTGLYPTRTLTAADAYLRDLAESTNNVFVDCRRAFPAYADMTGGSASMMQDRDHLSPIAGKAFESRLVMETITRSVRGGLWGNNAGSGRIPRHIPGPLNIVAPPAQNFQVLALKTSGNSTGHRRNLLDFWAYTDESVGMGGINYSRMRMVDGSSAFLFSGGSNGMGFPQNPVRSSQAAVEVHGGIQGGFTTPVLMASAHHSQTADAFQVRRGADWTATGYKVAGVTPWGDATFRGMATTGLSVANVSVTATAGVTRNTGSSTLTGLVVTNEGFGYSSAPSVTITGGGGSGATGTAVLTNGRVTSITLGGTLTGYTSDPTVTIAAPSSPITRIGTGQALTAGVATVSNVSVTANTMVVITKTAHGGTGGISYVVSKTPGTSFTITAVDASGATVTTDTSTFDWTLIERQ